ncbi:MAG TPA: AAA family ATPase, partial [Terriglobales bacterium]|nr:AAA family ATPase [Terriglobales bacterium]
MYLKYFGLRESPFSLTPNSKFFYDSAFHREALASLIYGINAKKGFVVVTGEVGTGKTTLIRKLLRGLEATHHSVFIFNTLVTFDELLENIMQDLGLDHTGLNRGAIIRRLNDFLLDKASKGQTVSLLIDEAQNLGDDALEGVRLLSNFETDREKLIQIILIGQPELEVKLNSPALRQLKQRVSLWSRLDRLSSTETESYIRHRLKIAGYQGPDIFTAVAIKSICYHASGTPRLINSICDNALLTAFAISKKIVSEQIVEEVVQDLQLKRDDQNLGFGRSDEGGREQAPSRAARQVSEIAGGKLMPSADAGEPWSGMRVRSTPQESQSAYSFGLKQVAASEAR